MQVNKKEADGDVFTAFPFSTFTIQAKTKRKEEVTVARANPGRHRAVDYARAEVTGTATTAMIIVDAAVRSSATAAIPTAATGTAVATGCVIAKAAKAETAGVVT